MAALSDQYNAKRTVAAYRAAFLAAGLDLDATEPKQAGQWIAARTAPIELATYLDHWAVVHGLANDPESTWQRLIAAARAADPDPWRDALRAKCFSRDAADVEAFRRLADDTKALDAQPTTSLVMLAEQFKYGFGDAHGPSRSCATPGTAMRETSGSISTWPWSAAREQAIWPRFIPTPWKRCVSSRPRSRPDPAVRSLTLMLGRVLRAQGKLDEAIADSARRCG